MISQNEIESTVTKKPTEIGKILIPSYHRIEKKNNYKLFLLLKLQIQITVQITNCSTNYGYILGIK